MPRAATARTGPDWPRTAARRTPGLREYRTPGDGESAVGGPACHLASYACSISIKQVSEPLIPLARAVAHELGRLETELGVEIGEVLVQSGTVVVEGAGLKSWGPRQMLEGRLHRCGIRYEVHMPDVRIVVYPT